MGVENKKVFLHQEQKYKKSSDSLLCYEQVRHYPGKFSGFSTGREPF
jgi:hypothetical protein